MHKLTVFIFAILNISTLIFPQLNVQNEPGHDLNMISKTHLYTNQIPEKQIKLISSIELSSNSTSKFWVEPRIRDDYNPIAMVSGNRNADDWCGTMPWWESRNNNQRSCDLYGITDDPTIRDSFIPDANTNIKYIRLFIHAFSDDNGNNPTSTLANAEAQLLTLNEAFLNYKIQFTALFQIHNDIQILQLVI